MHIFCRFYRKNYRGKLFVIFDRLS